MKMCESHYLKNVSTYQVCIPSYVNVSIKCDMKDKVKALNGLYCLFNNEFVFLQQSEFLFSNDKSSIIR